MSEIRLTQFSHGAGCGCKIAPSVLETILHTASAPVKDPRLLVGNETKDDAAVFDLDGDQCIISTTDFFMPIVDDARDFGRIASVNAISDVYAMGGKPLMAIAILGWPIGKLPAELAQKVLDGSRAVCAEAGIPLAGGHSIDSPEPIFGLAVTGSIRKLHIKRNDTAKSGSLLYLTKPLGVGIIATAQKRGIAVPADLEEAVRLMTQLNSVGAELGALASVTAMTDITGFGLLGHLIEICEGSGVSAEINYPDVPLLGNLRFYTGQMIYPDNTMRNWSSYQSKVEGIGSESLLTLCDPQTSGGLLVCVEAESAEQVEAVFTRQGLPVHCIGKFIPRKEKSVYLIGG